MTNPSPDGDSSGQTIAVIGAGHVGQSLGGLWAAAGYSVMFATRHPDELEAVVDKAGHGATARDVGSAISAADIVVLAVPYKAEPLIAAHYAKPLRGKMLVDVDNALIHRDGDIARMAEAQGEALYSAGLFPGTRFIRAFNMISASSYPEPDAVNAADFQVIYTTNDRTTQPIVEALIRATGGTPVFKGGLEHAPEYGRAAPAVSD